MVYEKESVVLVMLSGVKDNETVSNKVISFACNLSSPILLSSVRKLASL